MKKITIFCIFSFFMTASVFSQDQYIFPTGNGALSNAFLKEIIKLTGKEKPKICYLPTASGDKESNIIKWYEQARGLSIEPYVQKVWISSYRQELTFEEVLLDMDAIIVGGGNTLNMIAIWKAQGIDKVLKTALEKGIVLAGGSAGSLCWFDEGTTDSRPKELSTVKGLGFLPYSHSPHYDKEGSRRPLYEKNIKEGIFKDGYAMDNNSGIVFKNGKPFKVFSMGEEHNCYYVSLVDGEIVEKKLDKIILKD